MALPGVRINVVDGNIGLAEAAPDKPLILGPSASGDVGTIYTFARPNSVIETLGRGAAPTLAAHILDVAGGSVDVLKTAASVAAALGDVTKAPDSGPDITPTGTPNDFYDVVVEIVAAGVLETSTFRFSLDGGRTFGEVRTTPATSFIIPNTGITLGFEAGSYVAGVRQSFSATPALPNPTNIDAAVDELLDRNDRWKFVALAGMQADADAASTLAAAVGGHMDSLADDFRMMRALIDTGDDTVSNVLDEFEDVEDLRLACTYGKARIISATPMEGYREPMVPFLNTVAARVAALTRATNSGWVGRTAPAGRLRTVSEVTFDEFKEGEQLHNKKIIAPRSYVGRPGFYITNGLLKSPAGSDFRYLHWGLAFDLLVETVHGALLPYINSSVRVLTDGSGRIHPLDAAKINKQVNSFIRTAVLEPLTEQGFRGFFTAAEFRVDETHNVLTTKTLVGDVRAVPLANVESIDVTAGLSTTLGVEVEAEAA